MSKEKKESSFWHSKISAYQRCPRLCKYRYYDKVIPNVPQSADLYFGSAIHLSIEAMFEGNNYQKVFQYYWESVKDEEAAYGRFNWDYLAECGPVLLDKFYKRWYKHIKPIEMEVRRFSKIGQEDFEGTPDIYGKFKGVPSIIDFKTSAYNYSPEKIKIAEQLYGYVHLHKDSLPPVEQIVYIVLVKGSMSVQTPIIRKVTQADLDEAVQNTGAWIGKIKTDKVFPRNPQSCIIGTRVCEYFHTHCYKED